MAVPFKSTVFAGGSFAASGSNGHDTAGLLIYSASRASSGLLPSADLAAIGRDVFVYVSGSRGSRGTATPGSVLFGGDTHVSGTASAATGFIQGDLTVSGTLYASEFKTTIVSASIIFRSGSTRFGDSADDTHTFTGGITGSSNMLLTGDLAVNGGDITSTAASPTLYGSSGNSTVNIGYFANTITLSDNTTSTGFSFNVAQNRSGNVTLNLGNGGGTGQTKVANIVTGGGAGSLTTVNIGSTSGNGSTSINTPKVLVPGELQVTGSLMATRMTGSLTRLLDGTSYIEAGSNITVVTGSKGQITIGSTAAASSTPQFFSSTTSASIFTTGSTAFVGSGNESPGNALAVDSPEDKGTDNFFYVSGSIGKRGTAQGRNALFGGDVVVSGSTYASYGLTGSLTRLPDGRSYLAAGSNVTITSQSNGQVTISSTGGAASTPSYFSSTTSASIFTTGSTAFVGSGNESPGNALAVDSPTDKGADNFFYVSGSIGKRGTAQGRNALFGGDVVVSGSTYFSSSLYFNIAAGGVDSIGYSPSNSTLSIYGGNNISIGRNGNITFDGGTNFYSAFDGEYVIGNTNNGFDSTTNLLRITTPVSYNSPNFEIGNADHAAANFLVRGDVQATGYITASLGFSGSHTSLVDGRSFLVAGSNVTITSESNGQVTISSTGGGGGGSPAGSNTFVQFNDGGVFGGTGGLTFNKASGTLQVTGSLIASSSTGLFVLDGVQPTVTVRASADTTNQAVFYQESGGDTYLSNQKNSGKFFSSIKTSAGVAVRYLRAIPNAVNYNTIVSFVQGLHDFFDPQTGTTDVNFFVGGKVGSKGTSGQRGTALFAGDMVVSGSTHFQGGGSITGSFQIQGSITPSADSTYTLGTEQLRWGHVYTGDLHLRNERGDWTILEEEDYLCVINNKTGKKYRMMLQSMD